MFFFFFSSRRRHTRWTGDWSSDVCSSDLAFYVLEGEYIIFIGDREVRAPAGSFVYIPVGAVHGFRVGASPSRKLNLYVPQAMVGYFDELAAAIREGDVSDEKLGAIAERYG